jgi:hypothetical protein
VNLVNRRKTLQPTPAAWSDLLAGFLLLFVVLIVSRATVDAQSSDTGYETTPEIDVFFNINKKARIYLMANESRSLEDGLTSDATPYQSLIGAHLDYYPHKYLGLRMGYRFRRALESAGPVEHRIVAEQTLRKKIMGDLVVSDRSGEDFRWIDHVFSFRYRNRIRAERDFKVLDGRILTLYGSGEAYYDTRYHDWNRQCLRAGAVFTLRKQEKEAYILPKHRVTMDLWFARANDRHSEKPRTYVAGLTLTFYF